MQCLAIFINLMRKTTSLDFLFGSLASVLSAEFLSRQLIFLLLFGERISRNFLQKQASALFQNCRVKHTKLLSCVLRCLLLKQNYYMKIFLIFSSVECRIFGEETNVSNAVDPKVTLMPLAREPTKSVRIQQAVSSNQGPSINPSKEEGVEYEKIKDYRVRMIFNTVCSGV